MATDYTQTPTSGATPPRRRRRKGKDYTVPSTPIAGTQGRGGVTPLEVQKEISALKGTSGQQVAPTTPGTMIPAQTITPPPPALKHGVEGYVPEEGTVAKLDPDIEASIVSNIGGPIDATLANLTKAHYEVFGSLPSWSMTADLLDSGEVEFPTYEEALRFFQTIKRSYAASGKEWQLDAQGTNAGLIDQRERQKGLEGFGPDSDVLDPEMLASWAPKSVDDFLFGPYMKKTDANRVTSMSRQGRLRLDEMLIALPKQWAISNLSNRLSARSRRFNPDRDEDEAMMLELNQYLASRIPKEIAPAPTAAWQNKTEEALRYLQMMRASALYMASGGEDDDASGFLHTQGYSNIISTLEEQIRLPADQTGRTDEARRAWVQEWFVQSRNPGVSEKVAIHQLANLNLDMVTIAGQRQIGYDHLAGYAGTIKGWFEDIPGAEQVAAAVTSDEFQRVVGPAVSLAADVASFVSPAVMVPLSAFAKTYEFYDKYVDAFQGAVRAADDSVLATVLKPVVLPFGWAGLIPGQPDKYAKALSGTDAPYSSLWSEFFTQVLKDEDEDGIEWVGDFTEHFKDNLKRREEGLPADYASDVMTEMGINPLTHPEIAFLATFALDSVRDLGIAKVAGMASTAIKGTEKFARFSNLARTTLHEESAGQMFVRKFKDSMTTRTIKADEVGAASPAAGKQLVTFDKHGFVSSMAELFGLRGDDVATLGRVLRKAHAEGATDEQLFDIVKRAVGTPGKKSKLEPLIVDGEKWSMARSGRSNLRADNWGLSYRMREKALLDPDSVFYRGKHPVIAGMFERLWSSSVVPVSDERLPDAIRQLGFSYRTMIRSVDMPWAGKFDLAMLHEFGDMESITELRKIIASGDHIRYAGFIEGLYADSEALARRGLQMVGKRVTKENLKAETVALRERLAMSFGFKVNRRMLMDSASTRFAKKIWHTNPEEARQWNAMARAVDPSKPGDFVPQGLEHMMWEKKKSFDRKLGKGETGASDIGAIGVSDGKIMAPHQGQPKIKRQVTEGGPEVWVPNEQSVAFSYDEVEPLIQAHRDLLGLDPDSGMPPGIIQEMAKLEAKSIEQVELELKAVQTAHQASLQRAVTRHEAGIVKAMREKKTLDEQLELLNVLRAKSENRAKQLAELRAAGASPRKIRNAAKNADKQEQKVAAATIEVVRSKLPAHKELMEQTRAKAEEVRLGATERQGIKDRLGRIQMELQSRLQLESQEPQLMAEHAILVEAEQRVRQHYLDAVDEEYHWSTVMEFMDNVGIKATTEQTDAWRMTQTVVRERQASWRQINERAVNARIAAGQGRHLGAGRPRVQLRLYDPSEPHPGVMVDETLPAAEGGGTIKVPGGKREGTTPLEVAVNVDLPESDMAALAPPPWVRDEYLNVLRRYGDQSAIKVLQEWLAEQLYGYTKKADLDPRVVYSREQIQAMTQQLTDAGYPLPARPQGPASMPRSVKAQPGAAVPTEKLIEDLLVEEQKLISWAERAKQAWLDAYQEHRLIYRDAPDQVTMRGIREAENILMEKKPRPVSLQEPTRRIISGTATAVGPSMRRSAEGAKEIVEGSKATMTYIAPTQRGMRDSVRKTEIYFDSFRQLDQRLKAVQARINYLTGREAPFHEIPTGDLTPSAPLVAGTGTEAEAIAVEQAGPFMERSAPGRRVASDLGKKTAESGYAGVDIEELDELSDAFIDARRSQVMDIREGEVEVPPNQALHDTLARIASVGYLRGNVTLRVPMIGWGVGRNKAAGSSPPSILDAERWLTEAKLGARGSGEPHPLTTAKAGMGWTRIPEYETFTEIVGKGKKAHEVTYTRVKRGKNGEIVWSKTMKRGPTGGNQAMERLPDGRVVPMERPIDVGSQGPRFNAHEMYGQLTGPARQMDARSDMSVRWGGQAYADPATKTLYVRGLVGGDQIDLFNALRANGTLDEGWTITHSIPEEVNRRDIFDVERMLPQVHEATVQAERKFAQTYSELLGQVLDQMFADGRNAPILANVDGLLAERLALRTQLLREIELPEYDIRSIISGIQDGSDTGGLMAGLELGIPTRGRAHASFGRQSGKPFIEGPTYEVVGKDLRTRTIANIKDSDFTVILVQGTKKFDQVVNATVRGGGGTGLTMRECVKNGKPYIVIDIESPAAVSELQTFLKGKRGVMNVAGPRATNDVKVKDVLVAALRKETDEAATGSFEIVKMPFGTKPPTGVIDGHRAKGKNVTNAKPGEPGALGNPFVAKDAGGKLTREEAVAKFEEAFLKRVNEDPEYRAWVLTLRGKKVGYYKPDEEFIHLQVVQRWLEKQGAVGAAEDIVANAPGSAMLPLAGELRESFDQTVEKIHHELRSTQAYIEAKRKEIDELEAVVGPLEDLGELDVRGLQDTSMMKILFLSWDKRLMGRFEGQAEELQARLDDALALAGKTEGEVDAAVLIRETEEVLFAASEDGKRIAAAKAKQDALIDEAGELYSDGHELTVELENERKGLERVIEARDKGEDWGPDQTWEERIAESEQSIAEIEAQLKQVDVQFETVNRKLDEFLDPYGDEGRDFRSGAVVDEADEDMGGYAGRGEDYDGRQEDGPQPDEGPRELSPVEASGLTADELSAAAVPRTTDALAKINAAQSIAHTQARSAEYRFLRAQRELRELEIKLHASEQDLAADLARVRGGTARPLKEEDVENLRLIVSWLDAGIPVDKVIAEAGKQLDETLVDSAAHTLWLLQNQPDQALRWAVQPSREWQLLLYADLGHNPARLAKFLKGGATRRMESVWSNKFLFNRWSVDDGVTLYKTIVMAKISTMLRITMADEFTRLFAENMNPLVCLKKAKALKAIDKLPEDIQFKLSEMIGRAVDGPMVLFDISHPKAWTAYRHILVNDRRDATFTRYVWGKQLTAEERAAQVERALLGEKDANFVKMVRDYQAAGDEFRAWYALGYREEQGLRRIGASSHRVVETGPDSEMLTRQSDEYAKMHGPGQDQYADARNLPDHLVQDYDWWTQHPLLGGDWKPSRSFTPDEMKAFEVGDLRMPSDIRFGDRLRKDIEPSRRNWNRLKQEIRQKSKLGEQSQEELMRLIPGIWGHADGSLTGGIPVVRTFRDQFYRILDYSGSKLNEMVYAEAFTAEKKLLMAQGLAEDLAERNAAFYAREYVHRVMFNNATYMGEDMLRNFLLFLPAYRQFVQYWVPYLATHPGVATLAYRANRDKDQFQNMRVGPMSFDLSRMSFLINQGDNRITGWLPSGGPLITMPVSYLTQDADESSLWGSIAGRWPLEYAGDGMPLHSPLDKVVYGLFGKTLPWPFGSNGERNPWRELQLIRAAELKGQRLSKDDAYWQNRMNRLKEGGWNFVVPIGMRFVDEDVEKMQENRAAYNAAKTPEEVDALLSLPENSKFKTFIEWQNKPSWDQLQFLKTHPEIVPYMVSGFEGRRTNERDVGFLWSKLRDIGAADPAGYIDRIDEKVAMINRVVESIDARKARDKEVKWWNAYKKKHSEDHDIARLTFEWQNSEGEFAQGGVFWQQGKIGYAAHQEDLNGRFVGLVDPFTGITSGDDFDSDSYRLAKLMDEAGGHAKALLQLSPNYDMFVYAKLQEHTANTTRLLDTFKERRMATRMTPQDVRRAGYSEKDTAVIMKAVKSIDDLWDTADRACAQYGKYGYATTEGRAIRKKALEFQNGLIDSSPLLKGFLGDNITAMYGNSYLTKPAYEREELIRLDDMDFNEREAFYRVKARKDENGRPMWNGLFLPEGEKKLFENAELLGYVPTKNGWMTKVKLGSVVGLIKGKAPAEGKQITLTFKRAYELAENMQEAQPDTIAAEMKWLKQMKSSMPGWAERLVEDGVRAACWKAWLDLARRERHNLRTTINEYYSDAPGFSLNSKYGMRVKKNMLHFAKLLGEFEPTFGREFRMQNSNNEMLNSILGWYL